LHFHLSFSRLQPLLFIVIVLLKSYLSFLLPKNKTAFVLIPTKVIKVANVRKGE